MFEKEGKINVLLECASSSHCWRGTEFCTLSTRSSAQTHFLALQLGYNNMNSCALFQHMVCLVQTTSHRISSLIHSLNINYTAGNLYTLQWAAVFSLEIQPSFSLLFHLNSQSNKFCSQCHNEALCLNLQSPEQLIQPRLFMVSYRRRSSAMSSSLTLTSGNGCVTLSPSQTLFSAMSGGRGGQLKGPLLQSQMFKDMIYSSQQSCIASHNRYLGQKLAKWCPTALMNSLSAGNRLWLCKLSMERGEEMKAYRLHHDPSKSSIDWIHSRNGGQIQLETTLSLLSLATFLQSRASKRLFTLHKTVALQRSPFRSISFAADLISQGVHIRRKLQLGTRRLFHS